MNPTNPIAAATDGQASAAPQDHSARGHVPPQRLVPTRPRTRRALLALLTLLAACATPREAAEEDRPVYPPPPDPPRVQFLASFSGSKDVESGPTALDQFLFGEAAEIEKPIQRPVGVAIRDGVIYALDAQLILIHRIDIASRVLDFIVPEGRGQMRLPMDMHISRDGLAYITDRGRKQVLVFDADWKLVRELGPWAEESAPVAAATWQDRVYVADSLARCVRVVDAHSGEQVGVIQSQDDKPESAIRTPTGVAVDDHGHVYVVDAIYQRVLAFDKDLAFVRQIGEPGDAPGFFGRPKAVAVVDRTVWVLDSLYENCQILDFAGKPLLFFGGGGVEPGNLYLPRGIWIGDDSIDLFRDRLDPGFVPEKLIAITSLYGPRKISLFAIGHSELPQFRDKYAALSLPERPTPLQPGERKPGEGRESEATTPPAKEPIRDPPD